jgi:hypothetical protein
MVSPLKACSRCGRPTKEEDFALRSSPKGLVPRLWCKECDVPKVLTGEENRRKQLMRLYGITPDQLNAMLEQQRGLCAICKTDISAKPYVDHDHATGKVRSLLCMNCNAGLGQFKDNQVLLQAAIDYLTRSRLDLEKN